MYSSTRQRNLSAKSGTPRLSSLADAGGGQQQLRNNNSKLQRSENSTMASTVVTPQNTTDGSGKVLRSEVRRRTLKRKHNNSPKRANPDLMTSTESPNKNSTFVRNILDGKDTSKPESDANEKEKFHLREMLLSQLELIRRQNIEIRDRDRRLRELQRENEKLRQRLRALGGGSNARSSTNTASVTPSGSATPVTDQSQHKIDEEVSFKPPPHLTASSSIPNLSEPQKEFSQETLSKSDVNTLGYLETVVPYFVTTNEDFLQNERKEIELILKNSEVPAWRINKLPFLYCMEGTENIEDDILLKRHSKPEFEEKRRKRWDMQRLREQMNVERLKARYDNNGSGSGRRKKGRKRTSTNYEERIFSLVPDLHEDLTEIEIIDTLPVSVFGYQLPKLHPEQRTFSLPWLKK